jgi:hypothetical protein
MSNKLSYTFTVLRYVHDMMTGEFVNVGLVLYVPATRQLLVRTSTSVARLRAVFPDLQRPAFTGIMRAVESAGKKMTKAAASDQMFGGDSDASAFARRLIPDDDSALQWAPAGGGLTRDVERTFARIFERQVDHYNTAGSHKLSDDDVWRPVRDKLAERSVDVDFVERVITGPSDEIAFKHAWKNGVWHAYEPLSFDLANADSIKEKARRWRGHLDAVQDGTDQELKLHFVVAKPRHEALMPAYQGALRILERAAFSPDIFDEERVEELVDAIEDEVTAHRANNEASNQL